MTDYQKYNGSLTSEQFLFNEMRITAKLLNAGYDDSTAIKMITEDNLYQYPTEKKLGRMAKACIRRLRAMNDNSLIAAIAEQPSEISKQICLYAIMKQNRLIREFMVDVIGEKYRQKDLSFRKLDINSFFMRLQEQNDDIASWSDSTVSKIKQVIVKILVETGYLDSRKAERLNPVWLQTMLENAIRNNGDLLMLPAFNCFS